MAHRNYLVAYDVSDDKRRNRVFHTLNDYGDRLQFSVFLCALNPQDRVKLCTLLSELIDARADQVLLLDLGDVSSPLEEVLECLGKRYNPKSRVQIV